MKNLLYILAYSLVLSVTVCSIINESSNRGSPIEHQKIKPKSIGGKILKQHYQKKKGALNSTELILARSYIYDTYQKSQKTNNSKDAGIKDWEWKGPGNIGGRIRSIVVVPNKVTPSKEDIIVGSASGGIWKSTDEGATWTPVNDFMSALTISSIVVHPTNPDILYAATGEYLGLYTAHGAGIFKSTDRGDTWVQLSNTNTEDFIFSNEVAIDPNNPSRLFCVTTIADTFKVNGVTISTDYGLIFRSDDEGHNWTLIDTTASGAFDLKIDPHDSSIILVGCRQNVYRSVDGGYSFLEISGGAGQIKSPRLRVELAFAPSDAGWVYASSGRNQGELWRSVDHGQNWVAIDTTSKLLLGQEIYNNTIWIDPLNSNNILVGGILLKRSNDGGATFSTTNSSSSGSLHPDIHCVTPSLSYGSPNSKLYVGSDGGIYSQENPWSALQDSGWVNLNNQTLGITQLYSGSSDPLGTFWAAGSQDNGGILGGTTSNWYKATNGDGFNFIIDYSNPNIIYGSSAPGFVFKSTDGGINFPLIADFSLGSRCFSNPTFPPCQDTSLHYFGGKFYVSDGTAFDFPFIMDLDSSNILLVGGERLWMTDDGGVTFDKIKGDVVNNRKLSSIASKSTVDLIVGGYDNGSFFISTDRGQTWSSDLHTSDMPDKMVTDITINELNPADIIVSFGGYQDNSIWYSSDTGSSWSNISLGISINVNTVLWHPSIPGWIYAGTDFGIFASEDFGQNWNITPIYSSGSNSNDGPVFVEVTDLFWQGLGTPDFPYHLCAATYGRGIWRSKYPIVEEVYVDKNCNPCGKGTISKPYATLKEAVQKTGSGVTIQFLSEDIHDEIPGSITITDRKVLVPPSNKKVIIE